MQRKPCKINPQLQQQQREHVAVKTSYNRIKGKVVHGVQCGGRNRVAEFAIEAAFVSCGQTRKQIMTIAELIFSEITHTHARTHTHTCTRTYTHTHTHTHTHIHVLMETLQ